MSWWKSSYTRFLERELIRARRRHEQELATARADWKEERAQLIADRQQIENAVLLSKGVNAPYRDSARKHDDARRIPPAVGPIGPFGVHARNAGLEEERQVEVAEESRRVPPPPHIDSEKEQQLRLAARAKSIPLIEPKSNTANV